jgi:hypothetical protein
LFHWLFEEGWKSKLVKELDARKNQEQKNGSRDKKNTRAIDAAAGNTA